jgi:DDE superfamily endonuclease
MEAGQDQPSANGAAGEHLPFGGGRPVQQRCRGPTVHLPPDSNPMVKAWLEKHPRFHLHFTPTSSSWLNLVERWFGVITRKRIRRGVFRSVPELVAAIEEFIRINNENPKPFIWTKKVNAILEKVAHCKAVTGTLHWARHIPTLP